MAVSVKKAKIGAIILGFLGVVLLVIGIISLSVMPAIFKKKLQENLSLGEGKENFEKWKKAPIPVTFKVFIFNVTNPEEVKNGSKPHMQDVGPYVFKQLRSKNVLSWDDETQSVTYQDLKQYHFIPEASANMSARVYSVNLPLQGIIMFLKKLPSFSRTFVIPLLEKILKNYEEDLFSHRTARELLFDGYKVDIIQDLTEMAGAFTTVPEIMPNNTFGFLYGKNNSGDGIFTVYTGVDDINKYTQILKWNNASTIPFWNSRYCNMMNGTDGSQFPPPVTRRDILYVYTPELCRSVYLQYMEDVQVEGIPALRFVTPESLFSSPRENPDNRCYCTEEQYCDLSGILDISPCRKGMKIAVTGPHFYQGHPFIQERVTGLKPNSETHETYVDIEPNTGLVLRASRKLQMNFIMEKYEDMEETKNVELAAIPLIWIIEEASIDSNIAAVFTAKVRTPVTVAKSVLTACIVLGILWIATSAFVAICILIKEQQAAKSAIKSKYKAVPQKPDDIAKKEQANA